MPRTEIISSLQAVQAVFDAISLPVFLKDRQHRLVIVNRAFADLSGVSADELVGKADTDFFPAEEVQGYWAIDDRVLKEGRMVEIEEPLTDRTGKARICVTRKQRVEIANSAGELEPFVVGVVNDVTDIRHAEARARRAERMQAVEAQAMGAVSRGAPLLDTLSLIAGAVDELSETGAVCSILLRDPVRQVLTYAAAPGLDPAYIAATASLPIKPDGGSCGTAAYLGQPVTVTDVANDPRWAGVREHALASGLRACTSTPILDEVGEVLGTIAIYHRDARAADDAELALLGRMASVAAVAIARARRDEALRTLRDRLERLSEAVSAVMWIANPDLSEITYMSPSIERLTGRRAEELVADPKLWAEIIHPEDLPKVLEVARSHSQTYDLEYRVVRTDGETRWVHAIGSPIEAEGGEALWVAGIAHDVTSMKETEQAARAILESARDAIVVLNPEGLVESLNKAGERMLGYAEHELVGRPAAVLVADNGGEPRSIAQRLIEARSGDDHKVYEIELRQRDGGVLPVDINVGELVQADGVHSVAVLRDSTERKRVERAKDEFISTVSHELRTPLTSIAGSLGLLVAGAAGELSERAARLVSIAESNSRRLVRLINDILDIEKMQSGAMKFAFAEVDLSDLGVRAVESMGGLGSQLGVFFRTVGTDKPVMVRGDADRLTQVLTNLLSNAAKFSPPGAEVEVSVTASGPRARLSVRDRGPGIPIEFRNRIFGKFAQADSSDTRQKGGTGLGLAICKEIVERHGGRIWFDSDPGQGSTFHIELSLVSDILHPTPSSGDLQPRRLLVCEDDADIAGYLAAALGFEGFQAEVVHTVAAAEAALAIPDRYSALLLDLRLPDGSGLDLLGRLRERPETRALPVVIVSADANSRRAAGVEVVDWIQKPVDMRRLQAAVKHAVASSPEPPLVLYVDDDADLRRLVCEAFGPAARVITAESLADARRLLLDAIPEVAILDITLPDGSGVELLPDLVRANGEVVPVVIFSAGSFGEVELTEQIEAVLTKSKTSLGQLTQIVNRLRHDLVSPPLETAG